MTILAQLFWLAVSLLESDYEHEFLLALRLLARVLHRLPLDRPDARDKVEKLQQQLKWAGYPGVHALLLKVSTHSMFVKRNIYMSFACDCVPLHSPIKFEMFLNRTHLLSHSANSGLHTCGNVRTNNFVAIAIATIAQFAGMRSNTKLRFPNECDCIVAVHVATL